MPPCPSFPFLTLHERLDCDRLRFATTSTFGCFLRPGDRVGRGATTRQHSIGLRSLRGRENSVFPEATPNSYFLGSGTRLVLRSAGGSCRNGSSWSSII